MGRRGNAAPFIIVPTLKRERGLETAKIAQERAGTACRVIVAYDGLKQGFTRTVNAAMRDRNSDICILVDDCIPDSGWLAKLQKAVYDREILNVWFAGPSGPCRTYPQASGLRGSNRRPKLVHHLAGFCLYARKEAVGLGLNEEFAHYASDVDWQLRARRDYGARSLWVPGIYCDHGLHAPHQKWWQHDQRLLSQTWGGQVR